MMGGLKPYSTYKDSRIPWLGQVPEHWEVIPLKRIAWFKGGTGFPVEEQGQRGLDLPFFKVSDMNLPGNEKNMVVWKNTISRDTANRLGATIFPTGTIVFPKIGGAMLTNKRRVVGCPCCIDNNLMGCVVRKGHPGFILLLLQQIDFGTIAKPGPVPAISEGEVRDIRVALPPLSEQAAIVRFLDWADRRFQRVIRARQKRIRLLGEYKKVVIHRAVTGQIDVRTGEPYPAYKDSCIPWLGQVPEHWEVIPLKRIAWFKGGTGFPVEEQGQRGLDLPFFKVSDMNLPGNEKNMVVWKNTISRDTANRLGATIFPTGTIVFPKIGGAMLTNKRRVVGCPCCIDNNLMGCVVRKGHPGFILLLLQQIDFGTIAKPGPVPAISEGEVREIRVALPPLSEQAAIVRFLEAETVNIDQVIASTRNEIELLREFRNHLMTDVVTGKLDVREATNNLPEELQTDEFEELEPDTLDKYEEDAANELLDVEPVGVEA
ncbi:type I restriction enzyme specificity protein [Alicyclobacillus contaminans]|nr:type I restriction enzyme specificity protein [Alicyclobacillus contaminans]